MKTIVLANMKGGVGKTSISVSLAAEFTKYGKTILLDFDPQANATAWIAPDSAGMKVELADLLQDKIEAETAIIPTDTPDLYLMPTFSIHGALKPFIESAGAQQVNKAVKKLITDLARFGFLYCVVDLSPAYGKLERAAIISASETITPILADRFSTDGLESMAASLKELRGIAEYPIAEYKRIVINGIDRRIKRHILIATEIKAAARQTVYTLPIDQVFFRAQATSQTIQKMGAKPDTLKELTRLAQDIKETL
jgi:chromosome partitioning protein